MEIKSDEVYTLKETQNLLKVSSSTLTRLIKKGTIRAAKVGKQYRITGRELLRVVSPLAGDEAILQTGIVSPLLPAGRQVGGSQ